MQKKGKQFIKICYSCIPLFLVIIYANNHLEWFALHPFVSDNKYDLRVMTWNIHCPRGTTEDRQWKIADLILKQNADVVLLNEFSADNCSVLDSILRTRYDYSVDDYSRKISGDILYSRKGISDFGHLQLPIKGRKMRNIVMTIPVGGDSVRIFGMHLKSNNVSKNHNAMSDVDRLANIGDYYDAYKEAQKERCFSAMWLKEWVKRRKHPMIVMGDMNDFSFSAPMDSLYDAGMMDSWWEGGFGLGNTFHTGLMHLRIDYIYHSKELELVSVWVLDTDLSDHCPLVANFKIR